MDYISLRMGARGPEVRQLQRMLETMAYPVGKVDGTFGPETLRAVMAFQSGNELPVDGVVAANTWVAMERKRRGPQRQETQQAMDGEEPVKKHPPLQMVPPIPWMVDPAEGEHAATEPVKPQNPQARETIITEEPEAPEPPAPQIQQPTAELPQSGNPWRAIDRESAPPAEVSAPAPAFGDRGPDVADLQRRLQETGHYDGPITGVFGERTAQAFTEV